MLSVSTCVGGCEWPISSRSVFMYVAFYKFPTNPPNHASLADDITFIMILHSICNSPFYGGIDVIGVLYFGPRKKIHLICCVHMVLRCSMNFNIFRESFHFFCILLLSLYVTHCNLIIV